MGNVGVFAVTWVFFFPPTRPREVTGIKGTPLEPRQRGFAPLHSPRKGQSRLAAGALDVAVDGEDATHALQLAEEAR